MFINRKKSVEAKRVGSTLVAVFRNSNPCLVWKFDLERNHSFTFALQGEEGDLELGVTSPKGEFYSVARFAAREDADEAFTAVQKVLMKRVGIGWLTGLLKWIAGVLLVLLIVVLLGGYLVKHTLNLLNSASSSVAAKHVIQNGVPMPADQVLQPPP